jgi:large subunit ribosomal protein L23
MITKLRPVITEKSSDLLQQDKYTFYVPLTVNKIEAKKFLEQKYGVKVSAIHSQVKKGKPKRRGVLKGYTKTRKLIRATLVKGYSIETVKGMF